MKRPSLRELINFSKVTEMANAEFGLDFRLQILAYILALPAVLLSLSTLVKFVIKVTMGSCGSRDKEHMT